MSSQVVKHEFIKSRTVIKIIWYLKDKMYFLLNMNKYINNPHIILSLVTIHRPSYIQIDMPQ